MSVQIAVVAITTADTRQKVALSLDTAVLTGYNGLAAPWRNWHTQQI